MDIQALKKYVKDSNKFYHNMNRERFEFLEDKINAKLKKTTMLALMSIVVGIVALLAVSYNLLKKS